MEEFINQIQSPAWWIGVVLTGIITSLLASYLKPRIDGRLSRLSVRWAERSKARKELIDEWKMRLQSDQHEQVMLAITIVRKLVVGMIMLVLSAFVIGVIGLDARSREPSTMFTSLLVAGLALASLILLFTSFKEFRDTVVLLKVLMDLGEKRPDVFW